MTDKLVIVIPAYNEEEMLPVTIPAMTGILTDMIDKGKISAESRVLFVNDGSRDKTWEIIENTHRENELVTGINFSRNFGHQNAVLAGLEAAQDADMLVSIDADLQDDINAIEKMVDAYHDGYDVVYGVRNNRDSDTAFKRGTAMAFYRLMKALGTHTIPNHADFRLMSRRAVKTLLSYPERNLFLRGMVPQVGYPSTNVYYTRLEREAGESKYPLSKMLKFALDGITSYSTTPLKLIFGLGVLGVIVAFVLIVMALVRHFTGNTETGWSSLMISIWFVGSAQLISVAILGEYIGKIFTEVKRRPRFTVQDDLYHE